MVGIVMKKIDKIAYVVILILIVLLNVFIGSNIKDPIWIIQLIVSIFTVVYIIVKKVQREKNIIIKGKIDIAVLGLMIATTIPFIFKTYASLEGTVNFILKYWSFFGFYILVRNVIVKQKQRKAVISTLIISSITIPSLHDVSAMHFSAIRVANSAYCSSENPCKHQE